MYDDLFGFKYDSLSCNLYCLKNGSVIIDIYNLIWYTFVKYLNKRRNYDVFEVYSRIS